MKKVSLKFLNRLEQAIFRNFPENYQPVSSIVAMSALIAAFASIIVIFVLQMVNASEESATIVLSAAFGLAFLYSAYKTFKAMNCLSSVGAKISLAAYVFTLFAVCAFLFIWLAVWAVMIALVLLVGWIILKAAFGSSSSGKKRIKVRYGDGTTEEMEEDGKGICGETYYKGENGGTYMEP